MHALAHVHVWQYTTAYRIHCNTTRADVISIWHTVNKTAPLDCMHTHDRAPL